MNSNNKYDFYKNSLFYLFANALVAVASIIVIAVCGFNYVTSVAGGYVLLESVLVILISLAFMYIYVGLRYDFGKALVMVLIGAHNSLLSTALIAVIRVPVTENIVIGYALLVTLSTIFTLLLTQKFKDVNFKKADFNELIKQSIAGNVKHLVIVCSAIVVLLLLCLITLNSNVFNLVRVLLVMTFVIVYSALTVSLPIYCYISSKIKKVKRAKVDTNVDNQKVVKAAVIDGEEAGSVAISKDEE